MNKTKSKKKFTMQQKGVILVVAALVILGIGAVKLYYINRYNEAVAASEITPIRELVLSASEHLKKDAVVDPKTGDLYFPEAKLFLPVGSSPHADGLTYDVMLRNDVTEISVSSRRAFNHAAVALYQARNIEEMFKAVPKLQACQRGVSLRYSPLERNDLGTNKLQQTIRLATGKDLYIYKENCADLAVVADALRHIQSY